MAKTFPVHLESALEHRRKLTLSSLNLFKKNKNHFEIMEFISKFQAHRSVTPSMAELGIHGLLAETNEDVMMLTRVPGTGVEILVLILQRLQGYNAFKHIRLPPGDNGLLSSLQQVIST